MLRNSMGILLVIILGSLSGAAAAQGGGSGGGITPSSNNVDCSMTTLGICGNADADCTRRGGSCAINGTDGENGWHDGDGDGCGCQL